MRLQEIKCKNCGSNLLVFQSAGRATCEHCGTNYFVESASQTPTTYSANRGYSNDNPVEIKTIREDAQQIRKLYLLNMNNDKDEWMKESLCHIAALSYYFKKSYIFDDVSFSGSGVYNPYADNYKINKRSVKGWEKYANRFEKVFDPKQYIDRTMRMSQENHDSMIDLKETLKRYGFRNVTDTVKHCEKNKVSEIQYTYDEHVIKATPPVITPNYFQKYFPDIFQKSAKLKNHEVIESISELISNDVNKLDNIVHTRPVLVTLNADEKWASWKIKGNDIISYGNVVDYHQYGMEYLQDKTLIHSIRMAILENVIDKTKRNGQNMLDFGSGVSPFPEHTDIMGDTGIGLAYLETNVKVYKSW